MIRKAILKDVQNIHKLISSFAKKEVMLPRSQNYIFENIRDFFVYEENGEIIACCALHIIGWEDLAEIKSLSVDEKYHKKGVGKELVLECIEEAKKIGVKKIFALTFVPEFFNKVGFNEIDKETLPHKIWSDCINCPSFPHCDEIAVVREI